MASGKVGTHLLFPAAWRRLQHDSVFNSAVFWPRAGVRVSGPWQKFPPRRDSGADRPRHKTPAAAGDNRQAQRPARRGDEVRLYGLNAVRALFQARPECLRKLYLTQARVHELKPLLAWCVTNRIGYRVVEESDLNKLAASAHHEGVVADVQRRAPLPLVNWIDSLPAGPVLALWLDGVGNPHNFGAILRSAAHFGVAGLLLPQDSPLALSGAAARVAEGGAEAVSLVQAGDSATAFAQLRAAGFNLAATLVDGGENLFNTVLPQRLVYVMGAEGEGMDRGLAGECDLTLSIPGSGRVESLNVASATAVLLAQWVAGAQT